ncbi:MAG: hypothetical protein V7605_354, partial [Acidimicrobiaceae bacterium]
MGPPATDVLSARQFGVVTRAQCLGRGMTLRQVES